MVTQKNNFGQKKSISRFHVLLMATTAGISVANIYYNQPILKEISTTFHTTESKAGFISMLSQIGYGLGLFFITPLGDKINKKNLVITLQILLLATLLFITIAGSIAQMWVLSVFIGIFSVSVQVIMPMAAGLDSDNRGKNVGTIFTGVLIGILSARVFSGSVAEWFGWRYVYLFSAAALLVVTLLLRIYLPDVKNPFKGNYLQLLASAIRQIRRFSLLRTTSVIGALQFGLFCSFWTTLTFHLSGAPFYFHTDSIGLFGLVAIAGALLAPILGKKTDNGLTGKIRRISISLIIGSILLMMAFPVSVPLLIMAVFLLDLGIQAMQVTNVAQIYSLDETSHSRINTIFMTSVFTGGALGTFVGLFCWQYWGWTGVTGHMLISAILIVLIMTKENKNE
jgi:predicted MFS family arabinose efflux permease